MVVGRDPEGGFSINNRVVERLLAEPLESAQPPTVNASIRQIGFEAARDRAEAAMAADATRFRHPNDLVALAIAERGELAPESSPLRT
jgi:hypothetical protein